MQREKNMAIELMKFIAVIAVINSHFGPIYGKYAILGTGGAIGDVLFFFVSGFTIFMGRFGRFDNWYKRRIKRIYPSVIAWALVLSFIGIHQFTMSQIAMGGGMWFVMCIMIYYVVLFFIHKVAVNKPLWPFLICGIAVIIWYYFEDRSELFMYGGTLFKWLHYFFFMLTGAYVGNATFVLKNKAKADYIYLFMSLFLYYGILILANRIEMVAQLQLLSLLPLMGVVIYTYKICSNETVTAFMKTKTGLCMRFIAGLCLESYIVQWDIITDPILSTYLMPLFPVNLIITFFIIIVMAYIIRCLGRIVSQIFEKEDFDWKAVVELVN